MRQVAGQGEVVQRPRCCIVASPATRRSGGTIQHTRERLPWPADRPFRILSIDGGGIKGILPATLLGELEERFLEGQSIGRYFDLVTGTSTGGVIALGLGHGMTAAEIAALYRERGGDIFPVDGLVKSRLRWLRSLFRPAYDSRPLKEELGRIFGDALFGSAKTRICIPAFDGEYGEPFIYKTPHHPDYVKDQHELMRNVALATSAAPTYLRALERDGYVLVDGGVVANNPIMVGLVDALACYDVGREQVQILSLGCGSVPFHVSQAHRSGGKWQWKNAVMASMDASARNALGQAYLLIGRKRVARIDSSAPDTPIDLADFQRARDELPPIARALADTHGADIAERFLSNPVDPAEMPARC